MDVRAVVGPGLSDIKLPDFLLDAGRQDVLGNIEIVVHLQTQPETGRISKVPGESESRVCRDAAPPVHDFVDSTWGDTQIIAKLGVKNRTEAVTQALKEKLIQLD